MCARDKGSLRVGGLGITLGLHCTPQVRAEIARADVVPAACGGGLGEAWLREINPNVLSLMQHYRAPDRRAAYTAMVETIMAEVRKGQRVCAIFYGHPGVFVTPSHEALRRARAEGYNAEMLPGISAEDCLYADLGVDPGFGRQSYEARDFFLHARQPDVSAALVLWQIAVIDDLSLARLGPGVGTLNLLRASLLEFYPPEHEVVVYEAASIPGFRPRIQTLCLADLHLAEISAISTLFVKPMRRAEVDQRRLARLHTP